MTAPKITFAFASAALVTTSAASFTSKSPTLGPPVTLSRIPVAPSNDDNRAREAAERALRSPLIETELTGARGILLSVAGGDDLSLIEVNEAAEVVRQAATEDTNIIFGATVDERLTGQVWVTVVVTGVGAGALAGRPTRNLVSALTAPEDELEPPSFLRN